ncbi:MAG: flagellar assembly factor FliW [Candidatus Atribacteria bacterium]|nr:flagellar assembly factor FliW [Candidatus Atribacteria bacterium]
MQIDTEYFGQLEVEEERILLFPWGLPGFETCRRFVLLEERSFFWLQSVERKEVVFAVCDPFVYFPDYEIELPTAECELLAITQPEEVVILAMMNIMSPTEIGVNLLAPVVINCALKIGKQVILEGSGYSLRQPLTLEKTTT